MLYYLSFLDYAFSFAAEKSPLVAAAAALEGAAAAYHGDFSSKMSERLSPKLE